MDHVALPGETALLRAPECDQFIEIAEAISPGKCFDLIEGEIVPINLDAEFEDRLNMAWPSTDRL